MTGMASAGTTQLRHDPMLPWRDRLLDNAQAAAVFAETLGAHGPLSVDRVERLRVKYRVGESLRSLHRVWSGGASWLVSTRMRTSGAARLYAEAQPKAIACGPLRGVSINERLQTVFWAFPNDRLLGHAAVLSPELPVIKQTWPDHALTMNVVGYNPERAVIARIADSDGRVRGFAKLYAEGGLEPARRALEWLERKTSGTGPPLRVPRLLACDCARHVLVVDAVTGAHLEDLANHDLVGAFAGLGTALGRLHALPTATTSKLPPSEGFDAEALIRAAEVVAWARPDLAARARHAADLLDRHRPDSGDVVGLHGDMNSRNWLVGPGSVGLIDFDQAAIGSASADLAGVLGWLRARTVCGAWGPAREQELVRAFRDGYAAVRPLPPPRELSWFRGAALLVERALRSVSRVRPDQLVCLDGLVDAACADAVEASRG